MKYSTYVALFLATYSIDSVVVLLLGLGREEAKHRTQVLRGGIDASFDLTFAVNQATLASRSSCRHDQHAASRHPNHSAFISRCTSLQRRHSLPHSICLCGMLVSSLGYKRVRTPKWEVVFDAVLL